MSTTTLQAEGFRYCANPARTDYRWLPAVVLRQCYPDWTDVTDLDDAQFEAFVLTHPDTPQ
ncbi:hypothetical protein [Cupriavidus basilensis]|uniref:hypothetical protein n=1 Tax=Cupriavidus basilensis TaxID=68895 RepID=UPI000751A006|nr:hypothetical protein [Cupriavidus basilensis]